MKGLRIKIRMVLSFKAWVIKRVLDIRSVRALCVDSGYCARALNCHQISLGRSRNEYQSSMLRQRHFNGYWHLCQRTGDPFDRPHRRVAQASVFFVPVPELWVPRSCVLCKGGYDAAGTATNRSLSAAPQNTCGHVCLFS